MSIFRFFNILAKDDVQPSVAKSSRDEIKKAKLEYLDYEAIIEENVKGVIGAHVSIQSMTENKDLRDEIELWIQEIAKKGNIETTNRWHLDGFLRVITRYYVEHGGIIIRKHYDNKFKAGVKWELISPERIDHSKGDQNGFEFDKYNAIKALWIQENNISSKRVPIDQLLLHIKNWYDIEQYTPLSKLTPLSTTIQDMDRLTKAEIKAAEENAKSGKIWKTSLYEVIMKSIKELKGKAQAEEFEKIRDMVVSKGQMGEGFVPIPEDDDVIAFDRKATSSILSVLDKNTKEKMTASVGLPSSIVYKTLGDANYSELKYAVSSAEVTYEIDFSDLDSNILRPIIEEIIGRGVDMGEIKIPDFYQNKREYLKLSFLRTNNIDIEPLKTANANKIKIETGETSQPQIALKNGKDPYKLIDEQVEMEVYREKRRQELYKEEGLEMPLDTKDTTTSSKENNEQD